MDILVADDTRVTRRLLESYLSKWGHRVIEAENGKEAYDILMSDVGPSLAIIDWIMPEMDGIEVCRSVSLQRQDNPPYLIVLTSKDSKEDIVEALDAGAHDYITKPFTPSELRARINVGMRVLSLQRSLSDRVQELEEALSRVRSLETLLPVCMYCRKIRDDSNYWQNVEEYFVKYSGVQMSHGVCPTCYELHVKPQLDELDREMKLRESEESGNES